MDTRPRPKKWASRSWPPCRCPGPLQPARFPAPVGARMISTNSDLNRFYTALLAGRLLPAAQLARMRTTVPADALAPGIRYGLGLTSTPLSCGGVYWGHGGTIPGYRTRGGVTDDGRAANVTVTTIPTSEAAQHQAEAVDTALCR
ncbi:serine hydrolase [Streptomyces sp. NPDC059070]|uniref:serine hydrolase n=1 Tax=Streptomyces sp. NPDC059070 TaxID=3346713 RepID=UPI0036C61FC4